MAKKAPPTPTPPPTPPEPPRRLRGWRWKGNKHETLLGLPPRDISLHEAEENPSWFLLLEQPFSNKYYKPEYTKPKKGEH